MNLVPMTIGRAKVFCSKVHRHLPNVQGGLFAVGVQEGDELAGVAIIGRPSARRGDDGWTAEVVRVAVKEGHPNACSMLYGAARRAAKALGYKRLWTYTLAQEPGTSLLAAGWRLDTKSKGGPWSRANRPRPDLGDLGVKLRWSAQLAPSASEAEVKDQ